MIRTRSGLNRALATIACVWLLLAQHVGLAHAVWHALNGAPAQQQSSDGTPAPDNGISCAFDAVLGHVLGGAPAAPYVFFAPALAADATPLPLRVFFAARFIAALSRGPPALS